MYKNKNKTLKMKNNNNNNNRQNRDNNNNSNSNSFNKTSERGGNNFHDRKNRQQNKQQQHSTSSSQEKQPSQSQEKQSQQHHYNQNQRERSGQRVQHPDSSMNRGDNSMNQGNPSALGSVRFTPGLSTRELPPIETKADPNKKFTGRCRLFVGNLAHNTSEDKLKTLFEQYGEVGEVFLGPKSAFAFIKMDTRQNAEAARDALDCSNYENRTLRVRLAAHAAAIRVKNLSPAVTNELLAYAFRYFGEIERAVVVVDDKGKSIGEGVVEYSRKQSALYAIKRCQQECFLLTASYMPVLVEPFDQQDEDEGLPEKSVNKNSIEYKEQRDVGPRFAEQGSFEHSFALRWKELYDVEKQKRERLEQEIQEARKNLQGQIEFSRLEHDTMQLRSRLQQLEDSRMKYQQMKEQNMTDAQQREEQRRQQDMLIRQKEEEVLRRQQLGDPNGLNQQENALRMQANALQNLLNNQERNSNDDAANSTSGRAQSRDQPIGPQEGDISSGMSMSQPNSMPFQLSNQPRSFADVAMMGQQQQQQQPPQQQQSFLSSVNQQMGMQPPISQNSQMNQPNMFTTFMPQQYTMMDTSPNFVNAPPPLSGFPLQSNQTNSGGQSGGRQQKFSRQYNSSNNISITPQSNNHGGGGGRARKRGRY